MEARTSLTEHCGITAVRHLEEALIWLTDLLFDSGSDSTPGDELELCDKGFVFKQLCNPHGRVDQGLIVSGWRMVKVDTDKCQCSLELATGQIDLSAQPTTPIQPVTVLQPMVLDIPKETPKGSLCGLQEWDKGEVCAEMCMPPPSDTLVSWDPGETLCIKQWGKCKSLTYNHLEEIWPGGVNNVLKIVNPNCILPDVSTAKAKEAVALSLLLYAIKYLLDTVKASFRTLHPDLKDIEVWVMTQTSISEGGCKESSC